MTSKLDLRISLELPILETSSSEEKFQNQTLRPILKLQNEIYLHVFAAYTSRHKVDFDTSTVEQKRNFIAQSLQKDNILKNTFIGITIGMFTPEELETYLSESKAYNKRIITMLIERIKSQIK